VTYTNSLILGIVQGLTEFLPVSSSGHLVLAQKFLGLEENMLTFDVFVHFGSLIAVFIVFRTSITKLITGFLSDARLLLHKKSSFAELYKTSSSLRMLIALAIGTIPAVIIGFSFKDTIESLFASTFSVLLALCFTGFMLIATFFVRYSNRSIGPAHGLIVGIAQALAIIPGISRSGATISTALFLGIKREEAGEFSFLLAIPVITGATLLTFKECIETGLSNIDWGPHLVGTTAAFLTGWGSLVVLLRVVKKGKIGYFGFYCLALVLAVTILYSRGNLVDSKPFSYTEDIVKEKIVSIPSSYDSTMQKVKYIQAEDSSRPLLVALHTWSFGFQQEVSAEYFKRCKERDWHCIFPDFRGANNKPEACGSKAAMSDILDAVEWALKTFDVDHRRIFLAGASGGGHMALQVAAYSPSTWTAVSAWVPISDLARWHRESADRVLSYAADLENVCGSPPGISPETDKQYHMRSPVNSLWRAHIIPVDINAGIHDGHAGEPGGEGSVPIGHSIRAFNVIVKAAGKPEHIVPEDVIDYIEREKRLPKGYKNKINEDSSYGCPIYLRKTSGLSRLTIFEGGHEILYDAAFTWFELF